MKRGSNFNEMKISTAAYEAATQYWNRFSSQERSEFDMLDRSYLKEALQEYFYVKKIDHEDYEDIVAEYSSVFCHVNNDDMEDMADEIIGKTLDEMHGCVESMIESENGEE